jgi:hypothetical protein
MREVRRMKRLISAYDAVIILGEGRDSLHDQRAPAVRFDAEATLLSPPTNGDVDIARF